MAFLHDIGLPQDLASTLHDVGITNQATIVMVGRLSQPSLTELRFHLLDKGLTFAQALCIIDALKAYAANATIV